MGKEELEMLGASALANIISAEIGALDALINNQKEKINQLNNTPNRNLNTFFVEDARLSGYTVARDMLIRFIQEKQNN